MKRLIVVVALLAAMLGAGFYIGQDRQQTQSPEQSADITALKEQNAKLEQRIATLENQSGRYAMADALHGAQFEMVNDKFTLQNRRANDLQDQINTLAQHAGADQASDGGLFVQAAWQLKEGRTERAWLFAQIAMIQLLGQSNYGCRGGNVAEVPAIWVPEDVRPFFAEGAYVIVGSGKDKQGYDTLKVRVDGFVSGC